MMTTVQKHGVFDAIAALEVKGSLPKTITGVACDSRKVRTGCVFVALKGSQRDGTDYISDAISRGASAVVSEYDMDLSVCSVHVADARLALAHMSACFHDYPSDKLFLAGITGTNGKTTTAYVIRELLSRAGRETGLIGTVDYCIGSRKIPATRTTPEAPVLQEFLARMVSAGCDSAVMEVSSHALDQSRTAAIDFDVGVLTNLSRDHLDYHKTRENYASAKKRLFEDLADTAFAVLNVDDDLGAELAADTNLRCRKITYGTKEYADYRIDLIAPEFNGSSFRLLANGREHEMRTNMIGRFNVYNLVAALSVAEIAGVKLEKCAQFIESLPTVPGRLEEVNNDRGVKIVVDYAHTDDALEKVLTALRETTGGRLVLVFGCGGNRDRTKRAAMGRVASRLADYTFVTSDNPRQEKPEDIIAEIEAGFEKRDRYSVEVERAKAIRRALGMVEKGDVLVIAGKGHENFQEFANTTVSFDDRVVVKRMLEDD